MTIEIEIEVWPRISYAEAAASLPERPLIGLITLTVEVEGEGWAEVKYASEVGETDFAIERLRVLDAKGCLDPYPVREEDEPIETPLSPEFVEAVRGLTTEQIRWLMSAMDVRNAGWELCRSTYPYDPEHEARTRYWLHR